MKCPDCSTKLSGIRIGKRFAYRCRMCGGFFLDRATENETRQDDTKQWRPVTVDRMWFHGGSGRCPACNIPMQEKRNDIVLSDFGVKGCVRCGKHWWSGNTFLQMKTPVVAAIYKPAYPPRVLFMSVIAMALVGGTVGTVYLIQRQQKLVIDAAEVVYDLRFETTEIRFKMKKTVQFVEIRRVQESSFTTYIVNFDGEDGVIDLKNFRKGFYEMRLGGKYYQFEVK